MSVGGAAQLHGYLLMPPVIIPQWTLEDIVRLKRLIATGTLRGRFADREVTFRSQKDMFELLRTMEEEVLTGNPDYKRTRAVRFRTSKGLE